MQKEPETQSDEEMLPEYNFSGGVRGKYADQYAKGSSVVTLAPDVAKIFTTSEEVNEALRALVRLAQQSINKTAG